MKRLLTFAAAAFIACQAHAQMAGGVMDSQANSIAAIRSGTIDGAVIGGTTPAAGTFTAITGTTFNKYTLTTPATAATLTILNNKVFAVNKSLTLDGTDGTTMTFPATSASIARTDAANTFTGVQTFNGTLTTSAGFQFRVADNTSFELIRYAAGTNNPAIFCKTVEASDRVICTASGSIGATEYWLGAKGTDGVVKIGSNGILVSAAGTNASQLRTTQTTVPTCTTNCGTGSPTVAGTDTAGIITLGTTPASAFQVNFNSTWSAAPSCIVQSALSTMVVGKMPIAVVTTTTSMTVTTNGTAPATSDKYQYHCIGVS